MYSLQRSLILFICLKIITGSVNEKFDLPNDNINLNINFYKNLLQEIKKQRSYDGLLIVQNSLAQDPRLQNIFSLSEPKIIITSQTNLNYKSKFNSEIMTVVLMEHGFCPYLWKCMANMLNNMRQTRILLILTNIRDIEKAQLQVLRESEHFKFTNVLIHFLNSSSNGVLFQEYFQLLPYPKYHYEVQRFDRIKEEYFPIHWRNMKGKEILTLPDQIIPRSVVFIDKKGQLQVTGFAAKMLQQFAELYNATLKMPYQPKVNDVIHYSVLYNMTKDGQIDIPMSVYPVFHSDTLRHLSYITEESKWMIMTPCAPRMQISQVYEVLLTPQLFLLIITFTITFSLVHTLIDNLFFNHMIWLNLLMSDRVIRGILGQSFTFKNSKVISLRLIYILIFVMGLYNSTIFSAHLQTLITSPPYHRPITSFDDLRMSGKKILLTEYDLQIMNGTDSVLSKKLSGIIDYTNNATYYNENRKKFNTTYSYKVTSALWEVFTNIQLYYVQKVFCVTEDMNIWHALPYGVPLHEHSQYREPMNYFIHKIHSAGLLHAWRFQTFNDLLNLKMITYRDSSRIKTYDDLTEADLILVWLILVVGLSASLLVFIMEIVINYCMKHYVMSL
ncbi:LOW QUALITY PROTEIN: uncharacterized protein ACRADG_011552 [Cochliomyia hominivorax]